MSNTELILNMLAEASTKDISQAVNPNSFEESQKGIFYECSFPEGTFHSNQKEFQNQKMVAFSDSFAFANLYYHCLCTTFFQSQRHQKQFQRNVYRFG